ncbi:MAG: hypothetical protein JOZ39_09890, partial [Chloroflexi bacterium]|nr:hypothetical protein [Chloroflexota bacterium]
MTRTVPLSAQLWMADAAAAVGVRCLPAMHQRVRENVRHILGSEASTAEVESVARLQWRQYLRYLRDFVALPYTSAAEIDRVFRSVENWQQIVDVMNEGRGLVLVSGHFGSWDLAAGTMARHYPVNVIADTFSSPRLDRLVNEYRRALQLEVIPIEKALKRTISALRRNESVAFLVDKPIPGDNGV